jgi:hypothetical protein
MVRVHKNLVYYECLAAATRQQRHGADAARVFKEIDGKGALLINALHGLTRWATPRPCHGIRQPQRLAGLAIPRLLSAHDWGCLLFTDQDEVLFSAARPLILNGIEDIVTRADLADRALLLMLPPIPERRRRSEHALWRELDLARPQILGGLLDAAAHELEMLPRVRLKHLPRLAASRFGRQLVRQVCTTRCV